MAKSESTAVNELISLVQGGSRRDEPSQDLFAQPKSTRAPSPAPLERVPTGTSQLHLNNGKPVRMVTAPPTRAQSIPPLPQAQPRATQPPPRPSLPRASSPKAQQLVPPAPVAPLPQAARPTVPSAAKLPPPNRPSPRASGQHAVVEAKPRMAAQHAAVDPARASTQLPAQPSTLAEPPTAPVRPASMKKPTPANAIPAARTTPPKSAPIAAPFEQRVYGAAAYERAAIDKTGDAISAENWFEASRAVEKIDETWVGTSPAAKRADHSDAIKKILLPLVVLSVVSAGVAYVVFAHHGKKVAPPVTHVVAPAQAKAATVQAVPIPSTESPNAATTSAGGVQPEPPARAAAPAQDEAAMTPHPNANEQKIVAKGSSEAPAAAPAPAQQVAEAAPVVHEVQSAHGVVQLVDVRIDSKPAGATVMLVDNGKTQFLGTTPVAASVDPSRSYDVVLTLEGRPTQITHLDPTKTQKLEIALAKSGAPAKAETPKAPARVSHVSHAKKSSGPVGGIVDPGFDSPKAEAPADEAPKAAAPKGEGGKGTLMVSSKPPCEIWIDGNDTGMTTPQRAMSLPAGAHKVTFVNAEQNITKTVSVMITSGEPTKLIQNLLNN